MDIETTHGEQKHIEEQESGIIQPWKKQITLRGVIISLLLGSLFSIIAMKLILTTGISPHLNVPAAFLAFLLVKIWTTLLQTTGISSSPFTKQENTMIQTCVVACYGIASGGGFGSYLLGMNKRTFEQSGGFSVAGNSQSSIKEPGIGWTMGFLFLVCFIGLFVLIPLQKILIIDHKLPFPTGTATALLINGLHGKGDKLAKKQVRGSSSPVLLAFYGVFFSGFTQQMKSVDSQGFQLLDYKLGNKPVISYGMLWPLIATRKGHWFPSDIPESSMKSLTGYKVFISISLLLGDGLYNFVKISSFTIIKLCTKIHSRKKLMLVTDEKAYTDVKDKAFASDNIPLWIGIAGYTSLAIISIIAIPFIFPELKWYFVVMAYILAPSLAFCNAYGAGLMDINLAYNYGKVGLFIVAALSGKEHGVIAAMAACGLFKSIINVSCILMQDLKTGHLTLTSTKTMLISQAIGTALGCIVSPLSFFLFYKAFEIGNPNGDFKAPFAIIYRNLAIVGVQGFSTLPQHCLHLCCGFFALAIAVNLVRDVAPQRYGKWVPLPAAMAVPFIVGGYFAVDMCVGSLVKFVWEKVDLIEAENVVPAIASGFICGEGIWILPAAILALSRVTPPICLSFLPAPVKGNGGSGH